jgi:hypothetical protein
VDAACARHENISAASSSDGHFNSAVFQSFAKGKYVSMRGNFKQTLTIDRNTKKRPEKMLPTKLVFVLER